jgi:hypothetical protein
MPTAATGRVMSVCRSNLLRRELAQLSRCRFDGSSKRQRDGGCRDRCGMVRRMRPSCAVWSSWEFPFCRGGRHCGASMRLGRSAGPWQRRGATGEGGSPGLAGRLRPKAGDTPGAGIALAPQWRGALQGPSVSRH